MAWLKLIVSVPGELAEACEGVLERCGALAVSATGASDEVLLEPAPGAEPLWSVCRLQALLPVEADVAGVVRALRGIWPAVDPAGVDVGFVASEDWVDGWRMHAVDTCFNGRLWVVPRDRVPAPDAAAVLRLDPGLAFGTGAHPTTRLCLEWLAGAALGGRRVLDYGCGSGILAIAAVLLGADRAMAVDHDDQALFATRGNAHYNEVEARLDVLPPDRLDPTLEVDVVVANILANPLVELASVLGGHVAAGGALVLSGVLPDQVPLVRAAYPDFDMAVAELDGWVRLTGHR